MSLSRIDRNAMQRAIALTRAEDNGRREQIDHMRRTDNLEEVGTFCASHCQSRNLGLQPWQTLPIWVGDLAVALRKPFGDQSGGCEAAERLQKMLKLGLQQVRAEPGRCHCRS